MTVAIVVTEQAVENIEYVRRLLEHKQPGFAAALELAVNLVRWELRSRELPCSIGAPEAS